MLIDFNDTLILSQYLSLFLSKCPWSMNHFSNTLSSYRIIRPCSALTLAFYLSIFEKRPCLVLESANLFRPSSVLGPVLAPP